MLRSGIGADRRLALAAGDGAAEVEDDGADLAGVAGGLPAVLIARGAFLSLAIAVQRVYVGWQVRCRAAGRDRGRDRRHHIVRSQLSTRLLCAAVSAFPSLVAERKYASYIVAFLAPLVLVLKRWTAETSRQLAHLSRDEPVATRRDAARF